MSQRRVYVAGPMSGIPEHNVPAFKAETERLEAEGWVVANPVDKMTADQLRDGAEMGASWRETDDYRKLLLEDLVWISNADAISLLPGYHKSKGALAELAFAEAIGLEVIYPEEKGVRLIVTDLIAREMTQAEIVDDYAIITHGKVRLDGVQRYRTGTTILTLKTDPE